MNGMTFSENFTVGRNAHSMSMVTFVQRIDRKNQGLTFTARTEQLLNRQFQSNDVVWTQAHICNMA